MPEAATQGLLLDVGRILEPVSYFKPQLNLVPLLPFAFWTRGKHEYPYSGTVRQWLLCIPTAPLGRMLCLR